MVDLLIFIALISLLIAMPIGFVLFSVLLVRLVFNKEKMSLIKNHMPIIGAICVLPAIVFTVIILDIIFLKNNKLEYIDISTLHLFSTFISGGFFVFWLVQKKNNRLISDKTYAIWFGEVLLFTYPISVYFLIKMVINFFNNQPLLT